MLEFVFLGTAGLISGVVLFYLVCRLATAAYFKSRNDANLR